MCGPERSESGVTSVAVKPEMLAAPLQPSTAARAPTGLNRMCPPLGNAGTRPPQTGSLLVSGRGDSSPSPALLGYHHPESGCSDALGDLGFAGWCKAGGSEPCGPPANSCDGSKRTGYSPPRMCAWSQGSRQAHPEVSEVSKQHCCFQTGIWDLIDSGAASGPLF